MSSRKVRLHAREVIAKQAELEKINAALEIEAKELKGLATRDELTGIRNRHGIRDILIKLVTKAYQEDYHLSAMYIDLDKFKAINDNHGHDIGDEVLVEFAQLISQNIRVEDIFARWGGEEFILISPEFGHLQALSFAEKLRTIVEQHTWPKQLPVTCSIGISEYKTNESVQEFLKRADVALYQSKAQGRNCTTVL